MAVHPTNNVPRIYVPSLSVPKPSVPHLYVPKISTPGKGVYELPERKHAKDLGDLILGHPLKGTKQMRHSLEDAGLEEWVNVPVLNRIVAFGVMTDERFINPVLEGKPTEAFINSLETFGSSLDIIANPVKSLMPWAGGGSGTDLLKSMGWIEDEYRETYQWDTGIWLLDLVGEVISDPVNWFTFGSGSLMKGAAGVTDDVAKAIVKEIPEEALSARTVTNLIDEFATHVGDDSTRIIENYITTQKNQLDDLYKQLSKSNLTSSQRNKLLQQTKALQTEVDELSYFMGVLTPEQQVKFFEYKGILGDEKAALALEQGYRNITPQQREKLIQRLVDASQSKGYKTYTFWRNVNKIAKGVDELIMNAAIYTTLPLGLSKLAYKSMAKPLFKALWNKTVTSMKDADLFKAYDVSQNKISRIKQSMLRETNAAYSKTVNDWDSFLKEYNYSAEAARKHWLHIYQSMEDTVTDIDVINAKFIDDLIKQAPGIRYVKDAPQQLAARVLQDAIDPDVAASFAKQLSLEEFTEYCSTSGIINYYVDTQAVAVVRDRTAQEVKKFWANRKHGSKLIDASKDLTEIDPIDVIRYIDQGLLEKIGGLKNLKTWLVTKAVVNEKEHRAYLAILNYVGVTLDNHEQVVKLLNTLDSTVPGSKQYDKAAEALEDLLTKSKTGDLLLLDKVAQNKTQFDRHVTKLTKKKTNVKDSNEILERLAYGYENGWRIVQDAGLDTDGDIVTEQLIKNTDKTYEINIKGLQENLDDLVKVIEDESMLSQLDSAFSYAGTYDFQYDIGVDPTDLDYKPSSVTFGQALESCKDKAKAFAESLQDNTIKDPDALLEKHYDFINELRTMHEFVKKAQYTVSKELKETAGFSTKYSKAIEQYLNSLEVIFDSIRNTGITDLGIADVKTICQTAFEEGTDVMFMQTSKENMLGFMGDFLNSDLIDDELWKSLSDPNGRLRTNLVLMSDKLATNEASLKYATNIKEIISTIDTINLYREIMEKPFCSYPDLPDTILDVLKGEFFNRIYAESFKKQPNFDSVIDDIMAKFSDNIVHQSDVLNWLNKMDFDEDAKRVIYEDMIFWFRKNIEEYVEGLDQIRKVNNLPTISFFKNYTKSDLVYRMHELGVDYTEIMTYLLNTEPDLIVSNTMSVVDLSQFITGISARVDDESIKSVSSLIEKTLADNNIKDKGIISSILLENLRYLNGSALATRLESLYTDIGKVNRALQKRAGIIGTVDGKPVYNIMHYMLQNDIKEALRLTSDATNTYVYSTLGGNAFKTLVSFEELNEHFLAPKYFKDSMTNEEYTMFIYNWQAGYKHVDGRMFEPDKKYIQQLRDYLIDTYTKIGDLPEFNKVVIPKDPREYFRYKSAQDILVWDYITSKSSYNSKLASRYSELKRHRILPVDFDKKAQYRMNPLSIVLEYEGTGVMENSPTELTSILERTNLQHLDLQTECIATDYQKSIKDLETLGAHKDMIVNYITQDAKAVSNISALQPLIEDETLVRDVINVKELDEVTKKRLISYFGTEDFESLKMSDARVLNYLKAEIYWDQYESIKHFDAQQLRAYIDNECSGELFIVNPGYDLAFDWSNKFDKATLDAVGLKVWQDSEIPTHFIIRRTDNNITKAEYTFRKHKSLFKKQRMRCLRVVKAAQHYYYNDGMRLPYDLYTGDMISENAINTIKQSDKYTKVFGDLDEQKTYSNLDKEGHNRFFNKNIPRPNAMFVGDPSCYNDFMSTVATAFKSTEDVFIPKTMDLPRSIATGVVQATKMVNTQHKLLSLVANDDFYIGNPTFRPVFEKASNKEIKEFFNTNNFVPCVVKQNAKGEPRVYKIYIENQKDLVNAIDNKALILPYEVYRSVVLGINKSKADNRFINIYTRFIAGTYKSIWLTTPGFIMRNALDSMFYKNMASTTGVTGLFDVLKYEYKAAKIIDWYDDIYKKAIALRVADGGFATPNMQYIRRVLKQMPDDDKKMFLLMLSFERSGGSAGLTETVEQALLKYNKAMAQGVDTVEDTIVDLLYKVSPTHWVNKVNNKIERVSRLGLLLNLMDNGVSKTDAFRRVISTHFDYELVEAELGFVGQVFWFITFPIKNSLYYLNEGMSKNPDMLKLQMDAMEQSWNSGDITWDDVRHSDYLAYNAMAGNVRFKFNGKNIVLKTGSSVLDFFKVLFNPVDASLERLNPFLSVLLGLDEPSQLNPLSSVSNRIDQIRDGRSLLPSVYTTLYDRNYRKRHYIAKEPYKRKSKWYFRPRKIYFKKPDNMKRMRYKFSTSRYYYNRSKYYQRWQPNIATIEPTWYSNNYRYRRAQGKYNRALKKYAENKR